MPRSVIFLKQIQSLYPLASFLARKDCGTVADHIGLDATVCHFMPALVTELSQWDQRHAPSFHEQD